MQNEFKVARLLLGESQLQVAARAGLHVSVLSQIEHGWRIPTPDQVERLKKALPNIEEVKNFKAEK